jgi:cytochrome P450
MDGIVGLLDGVHMDAEPSTLPLPLPLPLPGARGRPFDPPPEYETLRATAPIVRVDCPTGVRAWLVSRYADAREVLGDADRFSNRPGVAAHVLGGYSGGSAPIAEGEFPRMDGADHLRFRRHMAPEISTMRRVERLRPLVRQIVDERIDALPRTAGTQPPVDLYAEFAKPLTTAVIASQLNIPAADHHLFHTAAEALFSRRSGPAEVAAAMGPFHAYLHKTVAARRAEPDDDVISRLIVRSDGTDRSFTDAELVHMSRSMLLAGYDTTASLISHALLALLRHPAEMDRLRADPSLAAGAAEEMVRYLGVGAGLMRAVTRDTEIAGLRVRAGDFVVVAVQSANRDTDLCPDADRLDVGRFPAAHLGFGHGPHQCVGQQLARLELTSVLATVPRRIPTLRLAVPFEEITFKVGTAVLGPTELPVTWDGVL